MYIEKKSERKRERERVGCEFVRSIRECWEVRSCFYVLCLSVFCDGVRGGVGDNWFLGMFTGSPANPVTWPFLSFKNFLWQVWISIFKSRGLWFYDVKVLVFEMPKKLGGTCTFCR